MKKIALAYSGGLDTSVILTWLKETYGVPVVAFVADVGQDEDLAAVHEKALATGASEVVIADVREEFVRDYVFPALAANAVYEGAYLLGTALARPVIAKALVAAARATGCDAVAHGATAKGNDQVRFELTIAALAPDLKVIAPWREWPFVGRRDLLAYAERHGIPVPITAEKPYSMDANAMHISYEGGILEDPWQPPPDGMFRWTTDPEKAPDEPALVDVTFEAGVPTALDGEPLSPFRLLERANALGARHGVGRVDIVENRFIGLKSRGVYETPGVTILMQAHRAVESLTLDREVAHFKETLTPKFAELVYNGFWFSPEMELLRATIAHTQRNVTGTARLKLYKGAVQVVGRKSPVGLYDAEAVSFETRTRVSPADAGGFIAVHGLRLRRQAQTSTGT
ncbi:MAG: argininosuccinate synthase [Chloracidobacterium sp.]|nr:argininosuccinate synthase [Chloracidobacterium sp.]MDW8218627.1 argininosuccinate synthase [Acidobacteriota bacterium]